MILLVFQPLEHMYTYNLLATYLLSLNYLILPCPRVLVGHVDGNPNVIDVVACGSDGVDGLSAALDDGQVMYGLGRNLH